MLINSNLGDKNEVVSITPTQLDTGSLSRAVRKRFEKTNLTRTNNGRPGIDLDENEFKAIFANIPGMAYRCRFDEHRTMEYVSDGCQKLTGYRSGDFVNNKKTSYWQIIHHNHRDKVRETVFNALMKGEGYDVTYCIVTKSGEIKWVRDQGNVVVIPTDDHFRLEGFVTDITDMVNSEEKIERQVQRFAALRKIDIAITGSTDLRLILGVLLDQVITHLCVDAADVLVFDPRSQLFEYIDGRGFFREKPKNSLFPLSKSLAGLCLRDRKTLRITDLPVKMAEFGLEFHMDDPSFHTYIAVPLINKAITNGVLEIFHRGNLDPDEEWYEFLEALAGQAAIAIENTTLFNELQRSNVELSVAYDATLEGWSKSLDLRDQVKDGHTYRVADMSLKLARAIGYPDHEMVYLKRGAILHDIGKIAIPDAILLKPGPLTQEEWDVMKQHPVYAYRLLSPIPNISNSLEIPYCHHERLDGKGYPRGLRHEQIPLSARIFSVADVWDALLSDRPYRVAWTRTDTIEYIYQQRGLLFQPELVDVFLNFEMAQDSKDQK